MYSEIVYYKKAPDVMMQKYDPNGQVEAVSLENINIAGKETYLIREKFIRWIFDKLNRKDHRFVWVMQVEFVEKPITQVQAYKLKKRYKGHLNEKEYKNGKVVWSVTEETEEQFFKRCKEDEEQKNFFGFFLKDYKEKEDTLVQKIFSEEVIENWYDLFQCCTKIKSFLCLENFYVFDSCDIGDEARLSLCFCKDQQEEIQRMLNKESPDLKDYLGVDDVIL